MNVAMLRRQFHVERRYIQVLKVSIPVKKNTALGCDLQTRHSIELFSPFNRGPSCKTFSLEIKGNDEFATRASVPRGTFVFETARDYLLRLNHVRVYAHITHLSRIWKLDQIGYPKRRPQDGATQTSLTARAYASHSYHYLRLPMRE